MKMIHRSSNYSGIFCMSKVGSNDKPPFIVGVYESGDHIGIPYLKIYNSQKYSTATKVTRLSLIDGSRIVHKNTDGCEEWDDITNKTLKSLNDFLKKPSRQYRGYSNWQVMIYLWNYEIGIIAPAPEDRFNTDIEAFFAGYYDTEMNLGNSNYMPSNSEQPDFAK